MTKGLGPACPHCGSIRTRRISNGWSEPDDHYLRYKVCTSCRKRFVTVEAVVPPDKTTFYRLDYIGRQWRREHWRRMYGKTGRWLGGRRRSDELKVKVTVKPSGDFDRTYCMRGHKLDASNTYVTPSTGARRCRLCRDIASHSYYIKHREQWNRNRKKAA